MKRQAPPKSKKPKKPPVSRNPKLFEAAFEKNLGQHPADYLIDKIRSGSSLSAIEYVFDILSADIAMKNNCVCKGFNYYYAMAQERMKAMSSMAQEESRSISENITWGQRKRFADGR